MKGVIQSLVVFFGIAIWCFALTVEYFFNDNPVASHLAVLGVGIYSGFVICKIIDVILLGNDEK